MRMNWVKKIGVGLLGIGLLALGLNLISPNITQPKAAAGDALFTSAGPATSGTTYYVDSQNGSDDANGTSAATAWQSLTRVNRVNFKPGDHILLNAASTWNNQYLWPKGDGSASAPIVIDLYQVDDNGKVSYTAARRPAINGNGTESVGSYKRAVSGAVQLRNQENWDISNLEVTNSEDLKDQNAYKKPGTTQRAGILVYGDTQDHTFNNIRIRNNYVHDVQSEYYLNYSGDRTSMRSKSVGGIIVYGAWFDQDGKEVIPADEHRSTTGFNNVLIEHNAVVRTGLEGIRTKADADTSRGNSFFKTFTNVKIKNNYLQDIAGDGIVLSEVAKGGLVEGNVVVRPCNADYGTQNYAGLWAMSTDNALFQYNEVYGIRYGYNDAEAFDIDMACDGVIYQYNYSHDNAGGFMLTMGDQQNSIIRYNVSANDGFGNKGTNADNPTGTGAPYTYSQQSLMHYWQKVDNATMPRYYNNSFYIGDGISTAVFGEGNSTDNSGVTAHFENNILNKQGAGTVVFLANYPIDGSPAKENTLGGDLTKNFQRNVIFPASIATTRSGATPTVLAAGGNKLVDPQMPVSTSAALQADLKAQSDTEFDPTADDITAFTSVDKLKQRTEMFKVPATSPAAQLGLAQDVTQDFFGTSLTDKVLDAGFAQVSDVTKTTHFRDVDLKIAAQTGFYPQLPASLSLTFDDLVNGDVVSSGEKTSAIQWDVIPLADVLKPGTVTVKGRATDLAGAAVNIQATVTFTGELGTGTSQISLIADQAAFVQKSDGNVAYSAGAVGSGTVPAADAYKFVFGVNYTGSALVKMKNASTDPYNRRIYVSVPTDQLASGFSSAALQLSIMRYDAWNSATGATAQDKMANTQFHLNVYATAADWSSKTIAWNNAPGNDTTAAPIVSIDVTNKDIIANKNQLKIDVSSYLKQLAAQGTLPDKVSFMLAIAPSTLPNYNPDNSGFDAFSVGGAAQAYADYQAGKLTVPEGLTMSPTALAPQLIVASNLYESGYEPIDVTTDAGVAPTLPEQVTVNYSDGTSKKAPVTWNDIDPALYAGGGKFAVVGQAAGVALPIVANVTVGEARTITSFKTLPVVDRFVGHARNDLDLPTTAVATLNDGSEVTYKILSWDDDPSNYTEASPAGTYRFPASVETIPGINNPNGEKPTQEVHTHAVPTAMAFAEPTVDVQVGKTIQPLLLFTDKDGQPITDAWSTATSYKLTSTSPLSVSADGVVSVPDTVTPGNYKLTATSTQVPSLTATVTIVATEAPVAPSTDSLERLIAQTQEFPAADFTTESWQALTAALKQAQAVAADDAATQAEIDEAIANLKGAINNLEVAAPDTTTDGGGTPGKEPGKKPGKDPGKKPGQKPGQGSDRNPGKKPSQNPGTDTGTKPKGGKQTVSAGTTQKSKKALPQTGEALTGAGLVLFGLLLLGGLLFGLHRKQQA